MGEETTGDPKSRRLSETEFDAIWAASFRDVAQDANVEDAYTARRFILQARLGEAELQMVRWTRWAVFVALIGVTLSVVVAVLGIVLD